MTPRDVALYGEKRPDSEVIRGNAGPVSFEFRDLELRHIRLNTVEIARRLYFAPRSADWDTVYPVEVKGLLVEAGPSTFRATWTAHATKDTVDYLWTGEIVGRQDGELSFRVRGEAASDFESPRIGLCLLLSTDALSGKMFEIEGEEVPQGTTRHHEFTRLVPRTLVAQRFHTIRFCPVKGVDLQWSVDSGYWDMEDQRNWAEATYKAFTAMKHAYPHVGAGEVAEQTATLRFALGVPAVRRRRPPAVRVRIGGRQPRSALPALGVGIGAADLTNVEQKILADLRPAHLLLAVSANDPRLEPAVAIARHIGASLLFSVPEAYRQLPEQLDWIRSQGVQISFLECRDPRAFPAAREAAIDSRIEAPVGGPGVPSFSDRSALRDAVDAGAAFLSWGVVPGTHLEDDETYLENTVGVQSQLETMRYFASRADLVVGPITIEPQHSRPRPDPRQAGLLAAAYTAGVIRALSEGRAAAATFFQAVGPHGLIHRPGDSPLPGYDADTAPQVYPAYHVLRRTAPHRGSMMRRTTTSDLLRAESMAWDAPNGTTVMLVNKSTTEQVVELAGLDRRINRVCVSTLDSSSFDSARLNHPLPTEEHPLDGGRLSLRLGPCAVAWIEPANP